MKGKRHEERSSNDATRPIVPPTRQASELRGTDDAAQKPSATTRNPSAGSDGIRPFEQNAKNGKDEKPGRLSLAPGTHHQASSSSVARMPAPRDTTEEGNSKPSVSRFASLDTSSTMSTSARSMQKILEQKADIDAARDTSRDTSKDTTRHVVCDSSSKKERKRHDSVQSGTTAHLALVPPELNRSNVTPPSIPEPPVGAFAYRDSSSQPLRRTRQLNTGPDDATDDREALSRLASIQSAATVESKVFTDTDEHPTATTAATDIQQRTPPRIVAARVVNDGDDPFELEDRLRAEFKEEKQRITEEVRQTLLAQVAVGEVVTATEHEQLTTSRDQSEEDKEMSSTESGEETSSKRCLWIAAAILILVAVVGVGIGILVSGGGDGGDSNGEDTRTIIVQTSSPTPSPVLLQSPSPTLSPSQFGPTETVSRVLVEFGILIPDARVVFVLENMYVSGLIASLDSLASEVLQELIQTSMEQTVAGGNRRRLELSLGFPTEIESISDIACLISSTVTEFDECKIISASFTLLGDITSTVTPTLFREAFNDAIDSGRLQAALEIVDDDSPIIITEAILDAGPTAAPNFGTPPPTSSELPRMRDLLFDISGEKLDDPSTPQFSALYWLAAEDPGRRPVDTFPVEELHDRYVAALLYFALGGRIFGGRVWTNQYRFLAETHICDWNGFDPDSGLFLILTPGITCDENNSVLRINLASNNLAGTIPSEISHFSSLERIDLRNNIVFGTIPSELGALQSLKVLTLNDNALTGEIPSEVAALPNLVQLVLYANELGGKIPSFAGNSGVLEILDLDFNGGPGTQLFGTLDELFDTIPPARFQELWCHGCNLEGSIPGQLLARFQELQQLSLSFSSLIGSIPAEIGTLQSLTSLVLESNALTGKIPDAIGLLTSLYTFSVSKNSLSGLIPSSISSLPLLRYIDLARNELTGTLQPFPQESEAYIRDVSYKEKGDGNVIEMNVEEFFASSAPGELEMLSCDECILSGKFGARFTQFTNLEQLFLSNGGGPGTGMTGSLPTQLDQLSSLSKIKLNRNRLSGTIPAQIGLLPLREFSAGGNLLDGSIPFGVNRLGQLSVLELWDNSLTGEMPTFFGNDGSLHVVDLNNNFITGDIATFFIEAPSDNLMTFYCHGCNMFGDIPTSIGRFTSLQFFGLPRNILSGIIPTEVGLLERLENFELQAGNGILEGKIPSEIGNLSRLTNLNLHSNHLTGSIPQPIASNCRQLVYLILHSNQLTGSIPNFSENIGSLKSVALSHNDGLWGSMEDFFTRTPPDNLQDFWCFGCSMRGILPTEIGVFTKLEALAASEGQIVGTIPSEIGILSRSLNYLNLSLNAMTGQLPNGLVRLTLLQYLNLGGNAFQGSIPPGIGHLPNLVSFDLWNNLMISGKLPSFENNQGHLESLDLNELGMLEVDLDEIFSTAPTSLKELQCSLCRINGQLPSSIGLYISLSILYIPETNTNRQLPSEIGLLTSLEYLTLYGNDLTGTIPASLGNLPALETIDFDDNNLSGPIPSFEGNDNALYLLHLNWNERIVYTLSEFFNQSTTPTTMVDFRCAQCNLQGTIPESLGLYTALETLYLQETLLFGSIPEEAIANLTALKTLRLEENDLSGELPCEAFGEVDFFADCGDPFQVSCSCCSCWSESTNTFI